MLGLVVRIVLSIAGVITGWFVAEGATNFSIVQMVVALLLIIFLFAAAAFGPAWVARMRRRRPPQNRPG